MRCGRSRWTRWTDGPVPDDSGRRAKIGVTTRPTAPQDNRRHPPPFRARVTIECLDWLAFIDRYDRPETLFYLDPPYHGSEGDYGKTLFGRDQFALMADRLARLKGRFILSINDVPEVRETFAGFAIEAVSLRYSVSGGKGTAARELIVSGGGAA